LIRPLLNDKGELKVVTLDSAIEEECIRGSNLQPNQAPAVPQQLTLARRVLDGLRTNFGKEISSAPPVLLCSSPGRYYLRRLLEPFIPRIVVISPGEIPPLTPVQSVGVLR
jgi:flagellar biosynthesis protein FlhA